MSFQVLVNRFQFFKAQVTRHGALRRVTRHVTRSEVKGSFELVRRSRAEIVNFKYHIKASDAATTSFSKKWTVKSSQCVKNFDFWDFPLFKLKSCVGNLKIRVEKRLLLKEFQNFSTKKRRRFGIYALVSFVGDSLLRLPPKKYGKTYQVAITYVVKAHIQSTTEP
jgi:hypothetical protein